MITDMFRSLVPGVILGSSLLLLLLACGPAVDNSGPEVAGEAAYPAVLERVAGVAVAPLMAPGFHKLPLNEKLLAYQLYKAAVAGRDIAWEQNHKLAIPLRRLMSGLMAASECLDVSFVERISVYRKLLWLNNGPYFERTKERIPVSFSREELAQAVGLALACGARLGVEGEKAAGLLSDLDGLLFDPTYNNLSTNKNPGPGGDMLRDSAVNYYENMTMQDLAGFDEKYPLNSRLVKVCDKRKRCKVEEQVYRAGQRGAGKGKWSVEPGLYAEVLGKVVGHLAKAESYAGEGQAKTLRLLARYFETGDPALFDEASIGWLAQDVQVDTILGFIETYKDPRGLKGQYEGLVYIKDNEFDHIMSVLAQNALNFEKELPYHEEYKNDAVRVPVATAIQALVGVGHAGPFMAAGINLPNAQWIREKHGSRSVLLTNAMAAGQRASTEAVLEEFALPESREASRQLGPVVRRTMVALHEVIGHGSGRVKAGLEGDPAVHLQEVYSTLEEARADLVALHTMANPILVEEGILPSEDAVEVAYRDYLMGDLVQLMRVPTAPRLENDHMRARHLISQYVIAKGGGVERKVDGKSYYLLADLPKAQEAVADLLREIMRIKAEGDKGAGVALVERYAVNFSSELRDEVVRRAAAAEVPLFVAFHMPQMRLKLDDDGKIVDVIQELGEFSETMERWDVLGP